MSAELFELLDEIEAEKGISKDVILDALESALISAYRKHFGAVDDVSVRISPDSGEIKIYARKQVVEEVEDHETQISLEEANKLSGSYEPGDFVEFEVTPSSFGRIAAQTARQVVFQRIREAEREKMVDEYSERENSIASGVVRRIERKNVMLEIDGTESVLTPNEQVKHDRYAVGERYKVFVIEVAKSVKGMHLVVSRSHPGLVRSLFELEVPEIAQGIIEVKALSREAGSRSKIAVHSTVSGVDPVGTCIGPKGMRVQAVIAELRGEKIDIIRYSEDPGQYVKNALSPADVVSIDVDAENRMCKVKVPESQLSLAIGKEGQNVRLAARLTGWKIDLSAVPDSELGDSFKKNKKKRSTRLDDEFTLSDKAAGIELGALDDEALISDGDHPLIDPNDIINIDDGEDFMNVDQNDLDKELIEAGLLMSDEELEQLNKENDNLGGE
ncbi:MAG TPA: transcription termination factor NusA [Firmicutes bacterium]|nr:transcription termination factor NusA [Bacillota bacterium]